MALVNINSFTDPTAPAGTILVTIDWTPSAGNLLVVAAGGRDSDNNATPSLSLSAANVSDGWASVGQLAPMEYHTVLLGWKVADGTENSDIITVENPQNLTSRWVVVFELSLGSITDWELDASALNGSNTSNVSSIASGSTGTLSSSTGLAVCFGASRTASEGLSFSGVGTLYNLDATDTVAKYDAGQANYIVDVFELSATTALNVTTSESTGSSRMGSGVAVFVEAGGAGIEQPVGQAAESDQAQALTSAKSKAAGQATEADVALALGASKSRGLVSAAESNTVFPLAVAKARLLGQATESDSALGMDARKTRALGPTAESDAVFTPGSAKARSLGLVSEADSALAQASVKLRSLGFTTEVDSAFGLTQAGPAGTIGPAAETNQVFALTPIKTRTIGLAAATETTFALTTIKARTLSVALETDSPFSLTEQGAAAALGLALETNEVLPLVVVKTRGLGLVQESDAAQSLVVAKVRELGLATETDSVSALGSAKARALGLATETDAVFALTVVGGTDAPTIVAVELAYTAATCSLAYGGASVELEFV